MNRILRVDDRLIHGQVIIGWVDNLSISQLFLAHDDLPQDIIELYSNMLASSVSFNEINLRTQERTDFTAIRGKALMIVRDIHVLHRYMDLFTAFEPDLLNIGGIRTENGRKRFTDFIWLSDDDIRILKEVAAGFECRINARELPDSREYDIISMIKK